MCLSHRSCLVLQLGWDNVHNSYDHIKYARTRETGHNSSTKRRTMLIYGWFESQRRGASIGSIVPSPLPSNKNDLSSINSVKNKGVKEDGWMSPCHTKVWWKTRPVPPWSFSTSSPYPMPFVWWGNASRVCDTVFQLFPLYGEWGSTLARRVEGLPSDHPRSMIAWPIPDTRASHIQPCLTIDDTRWRTHPSWTIECNHFSASAWCVWNDLPA